MSAGFLIVRLAKPAAAPTHKTRIAHIRVSGPRSKLPPLDTLVMGATVTVDPRPMAFFAVTRAAVSAAPACRPSTATWDDFVAVAEQFPATPYLWGGRQFWHRLFRAGAGLVERPRVSLPARQLHQQDGLGKALDAAESRKLRRGD